MSTGEHHLLPELKHPRKLLKAPLAPALFSEWQRSKPRPRRKPRRRS